jgi:DNA-binding protein HU-beta
MSTKANAIAKLAESMNVSKAQAATVYEQVASIALATVKAEGLAIIPGLGRLKVNVRPARKARNPKTGAVIDVPQRTILKLVPSKDVKDQF